MSRYQRTTNRRYMWGIGMVCSLLLLAFAFMAALEGRLGYRLRSFDSEASGEIRKDDSPIRFWAITGFLIVSGSAGVIATGIGLSRVQRDEDKPA